MINGSLKWLVSILVWWGVGLPNPLIGQWGDNSCEEGDTQRYLSTRIELISMN